MYKVIITTVLDPDVKAELTKYSKKTYIPYGKLIEYSLNDFTKKLGKSKSYNMQYADFDRIKTQSFTSSVPENINAKLIDTAKRLDISKRLLLREIISDFVNNLEK